MRAIYFALIAAALSSAGCAGMIVGSGQNLSDLKDQAAVQAAFGSPTAAGEADGRPFEEFTTRRKIAEPWRVAPGMAMMYAMTLGLGEVVLLPVELYRTGRRTILGQQLRFTYDADGRVAAIRWDGDSVWWGIEATRLPLTDSSPPK